MRTYREVSVTSLHKGDIYDLVNEVVRVRRNSLTDFLDVTVNILDTHGHACSRMTRHYFPHDTVMIQEA